MAKPPGEAEHTAYHALANREPDRDDIEQKGNLSAQSGDASSLTLVESLGPFCIWTYAMGYAVIGGCIAFLIFLWSSDGNNLVWQHIARGGWMTRCVSLSSTLVRLAIAIQAASATSIIAAVLLQEYRVRLLHAPALSMMRWENSGPWALTQLMLSKFSGGNVSINEFMI